MFDDLQARLKAATDAILNHPARKKVITAGPGAGKTFLFGEVLKRLNDPDRSVVLTFINNLKSDLEKELGHLSRVFTFHGYCRHLLHQHTSLRGHLSGNFKYFPPLATLIAGDWAIEKKQPAPPFIAHMRELEQHEITAFYLKRSDYYDAVGFDDSVFRVHQRLIERPEDIREYAAVLVDEFQDFNRLEASFIDLLATKSPTLVAGDDDQALYSMRSSSPQFIRDLVRGGIYEPFSLPFCMRCTEPVVGATNDVIAHAVKSGYLASRLPKEYLYYPPKKAADTEQYPRIRLVQVSAQSLRVNYFGRYIEQQIHSIPEDEIKESHEKNFPTVLVIGPKQYLHQINEHLKSRGFSCSTRDENDAMDFSTEDGLHLLKEDRDSNLGWRIILETEKPAFAKEAINNSISGEMKLVDLIPPEFRDELLKRVAELKEEEEAEIEPVVNTGPTIRLTSFEGSKGLSAQHVFIVGVQEGAMPRNSRRPSDVDICKFLVALTRTRKQCHLLYTWRWSGEPKRPSLFLNWIDQGRFEPLKIDKNYWGR